MIEISEAKRLLTAEEFAGMPESEHAELIRGEINPIMATFDYHGELSGDIYFRLRSHCLANNIGVHMTVEGASYLLSRDPDTVRMPDVGLLLKSSYTIGIRHNYYASPPDIAVEIVSDNDRAGDVQDKVNEYLGAGSKIVWVVYPISRQIMVHTPKVSKLYNRNDNIDGGEVLPGFTVTLDELFSIVISAGNSRLKAGEECAVLLSNEARLC